MKYPEISNRELLGIALLGLAVALASSFIMKQVGKGKEPEQQSNFGLNEMQEKFNEQNKTSLSDIQDAWDKRNM
jgi:Co/Zn/Cd efflux system component